MFKFLWKTEKSLSFRQTVNPYVINQKEVDNYNALEDKVDVDIIEPIYVEYKDYGVFNTKIVTNQAQINIQNEEMKIMVQEEIDALVRIEPIYEDKNDYTNYFDYLEVFEWKDFNIACQNYLSSL